MISMKIMQSEDTLRLLGVAIRNRLIGASLEIGRLCSGKKQKAFCRNCWSGTLRQLIEGGIRNLWKCGVVKVCCDLAKH